MKDYILNWNQKRILKKVEFLKRYGFYLAGGAALALELGHRTSRDLDFYTPHHFKGLELTREFQKIFGKDLRLHDLHRPHRRRYLQPNSKN